LVDPFQPCECGPERFVRFFDQGQRSFRQQPELNRHMFGVDILLTLYVHVPLGLVYADRLLDLAQAFEQGVVTRVAVGLAKGRLSFTVTQRRMVTLWP
jgi:hypothetical protein